MKSSLTLAICIAAFPVFLSPTDAAPIASDHFDYPPGVISGANGGAGFWDAYSGNGLIGAPTLQYMDQNGDRLSVGGNHVTTSTDGGGMWRSINNQDRPP